MTGNEVRMGIEKRGSVGRGMNAGGWESCLASSKRKPLWEVTFEQILETCSGALREKNVSVIGNRHAPRWRNVPV